MIDLVKKMMMDRHYRIFVVLSYKVFVRWASVSHAEMSQRQNYGNGIQFHGEWLAWRDEKPC